jgi:hypothetical protein
VVDEDDALTSIARGHDLVAEDRPRRRASDFLDVGPAQPARQDANEVAVSLRLFDIAEPWLPVAVEHDRAHYASLPKNELEIA